MLQALPPDPAGEVVIVTGKALPDAAAERAHHVDVFNSKDLANSPAHELDSVLGQVPGLQLFRRSDSTSGHPTGQGVTLRALGGNASSRALLVLDGVPQADPFGGWVNWPAYDAAGLEDARVVRGGGSVSRGPGALAGVIELNSLALSGFNGSIEGGSRESLRAYSYLGANLGPGLVTFDAQGARSDGFTPVTSATRGPVDRDAPYQEASVRARYVSPVGQSAELQISALAFADERDRGVPFTGNDTHGADLAARLVGHGSWQWSALGYAQWRSLRSSFASVNNDRSAATRVSLQDSVPSRGLGGGFEVRPPLGEGFDLSFGGDARFVTGESRELYAYVSGEPTRRRASGGDSATAGLFAEGSLHRGRMTLSAGGRLDHWRIADGELVERPLAGGPATRDESFGERTGWRPTARASIVYDATAAVQARLAAYTGWRLPTLNELFRPFRAGPDATAANPLLDPERLKGVEAGIRFHRDGLGLDLTAFANRLESAIANVTLGHGPGTFPGVGSVTGDYRQRQNLDAVNVRGLEASADLERGPWSLRLGASWTRARVSAHGAAGLLDGLRPAQTPNLVLTGAVGWDREGRSLSLTVRHVGDQFDDDLNQHRLPPATTVDAFAAWPVTRSLQLTARVQNMFNEEVIAGEADDGTVERATPRTLWLGLRFSDTGRRGTRR